MFTAKVNNLKPIQLHPDELDQLDILKLSDSSYHLIQDQRSFSIEILQFSPEEKTVELRLNGQSFNVALEDAFDQLVKEMGFSATQGKRVNQVKAPMPGLVLEILVKEGQEVQKNEGLLILEAMKMENVIKAPEEVKVKKIRVEKGASVEKNQLLIEFE